MINTQLCCYFISLFSIQDFLTPNILYKLNVCKHWWMLRKSERAVQRFLCKCQRHFVVIIGSQYLARWRKEILQRNAIPHCTWLHLPNYCHLNSCNVVLLPELMQWGVGYFVLVLGRANFFWPCAQEKHKKLTDQFSDQNGFSVEDPWETRKCHIYAFLKRLFLHVLFSLVFYLYTCNIQKKKRFQMSFWLVLWMQMLWFYLSGMIVKTKKMSTELQQKLSELISAMPHGDFPGISSRTVYDF